MISVVLPCFNEEDSIQKNIDSIKKELDKYGKDYEIIVVDDGSKDNSQEKLKNLDIKIVNHPHNIGYGAALKTGINNARFDTIVISDIDDSYPSKHISELLNIYFESSQSSSGYDMVVGARKGKEYYGSFFKFLFRKLLKYLVQWTTGRKIVDVNSGLRVFSKKTISSFLPHLCNTFSFTTSLTLAYMLNTKFVKYHPIEYEVRTGKSHVKIFRDSLRTLQYIVEAIIYYNPLKLFLLFFIFFIITSITLLFLNLNNPSTIYIFFSGFSFMLSFISLFFGFLLDLIRQNSNKKNNE
tara:strand:+ start:576 stop:1463 length:888 start_codon:yes stop_codon:yes gene_type:complete